MFKDAYAVIINSSRLIRFATVPRIGTKWRRFWQTTRPTNRKSNDPVNPARPHNDTNYQNANSHRRKWILANSQRRMRIHTVKYWIEMQSSRVPETEREEMSSSASRSNSVWTSALLTLQTNSHNERNVWPTIFLPKTVGSEATKKDPRVGKNYDGWPISKFSNLPIDETSI